MQIVDVDLEAKGNLAGRWVGYTRAANRDLIGRSYSKTEFLRETATQALDSLAAYPERARCVK